MFPFKNNGILVYHVYCFKTLINAICIMKTPLAAPKDTFVLLTLIYYMYNYDIYSCYILIPFQCPALYNLEDHRFALPHILVNTCIVLQMVY